MIDSMGYTRTTAQRAPSFNGAVVDFVKTFEQNLNRQTLLMSHIPLYRGYDVSCGQLRGSKPDIRWVGITYFFCVYCTIHFCSYFKLQGSGVSYQNLLISRETSSLLSSVQPLHVFSGDDHAPCQIQHVSGGKAIPEDTVPTFSWLMGETSPGYLLATLDAGTPRKVATVTSKYYFCPSQL